MNEADKKKLYAALSAPFPEEAIERTKGSITGKGYDTAGVRAQFLINRINEVLGVGCYRIHRSISAKSLTTAKGRTMFEAICDMTVELGEWRDGSFVAFAESVADGGHVAVNEFDAKKGAHTNALKRCLAGFGIGKAAWEGRLDDDNSPFEAAVESQVPTRKPHMALAVTQRPADIVAPNQEIATVEPASGQRIGSTERNRLSSKQLAAVWSIARKLGVEQAGFRSKVKVMFGVQLEFLSRDQASQLITKLNTQLNGNGSAHGEYEQQGVA